MKGHCLKLVLAAGWLLGTAASLCAQKTNTCRSTVELRGQIEARLAQPKFAAALWGVKIVSLDTGQTVFEHHPDRLMSPASNSKLYTAALALDRLGGDYRIATPVYTSVKISSSGYAARQSGGVGPG